MGFKMPHIAIIAGIVCCGVALIFQTVGVATTGWIKVSGGLFDLEIGLWKSCNGGSCESSGDDTDWILACRAFGIVGLLVIAACLLVAVLICFLEKENLPSIAMLLAVVAALCVLVEFAIFAGKKEDKFSEADLGYSFALTVIAWVLCGVAAVCFRLPSILGGSS